MHSATDNASPIAESAQRILIVRLSSMGDVIHALPAVAMLRQAFPQATFGWLVEERWTELLCAFSQPRSGKRSPARPLVDAVHVVGLKGWRSTLLSTQTWERMGAALSDLRSRHYDIALDLQGALRSAVLARWSGAPTICGAAAPRENAAGLWYSRKVITEGRHVVEQNAELARAVIGHGCPIPDAVFPRDVVAEQKVEKRLEEACLQDFVILNPGAGWGAKQWPAERYGNVAQGLAKRGVRSLINFGPREEGLAKVAENASGGAAHAMSFSVGELIALTRRARLFVGGDTGPMHLAAALHVPVVALFGPTDPARNGPFGTRSTVLRRPNSRTSLTHRNEPDPGLLEITPEEVVEASGKLLESSHG